MSEDHEERLVRLERAVGAQGISLDEFATPADVPVDDGEAAPSDEAPQADAEEAAAEEETY
jgi:hypothetical protein